MDKARVRECYHELYSEGEITYEELLLLEASLRCLEVNTK